MKTILPLCSLIFVIVVTLAIAGIQPPAEHVEAEMAHVEAAEQPKVPKPVDKPPKPVKPVKQAEVKPPAKKPAPAKPKPRGIGCGPHSPKLIYDILREIGVPRAAAIQQVGSWKHESGLDQCQKRGDNGIAWGLNSWHPGRRADMPQELRAQIRWAVHTEMPRDCRSCYEKFMAAGSIWSIRDAIKRSTRWGIEGKRWYYADMYSSQL